MIMYVVSVAERSDDHAYSEGRLSEAWSQEEYAVDTFFTLVASHIPFFFANLEVDDTLPSKILFGLLFSLESCVGGSYSNNVRFCTDFCERRRHMVLLYD